MSAYPAVRMIEAIQIEHEGQPMAVLRDPEGLLEEALVVPLPLVLVMSLLDGRRGGREVQEAVAHLSGGQIIPVEQIDQIVEQLDEHYLLYNERTAELRRRLEAEFDALPARPAAHAGAAYPANREECRAMLDGLFEEVPLLDGQAAHPRGLIVPHIDLRVGGVTLAHALARLDGDRPAGLYIVLGVAHQPARNLFTVTEKSFETPMGLVETDTAAVDRLRELYGADRLAGHIVHKNEHSVEFVALGLRYVYPEPAPLRILPVLCGPLAEEAAPIDLAPRDRDEVGTFIDALRTIIDERDGDVCIIASVDLSHVGMKFGDEQGIDDIRQAMVRSRDSLLLDQIEARDPEAFFNHFREDNNARNVDAVTAVYVMLHALGAEGRVDRIDYQQWHEQETDSLVSYAGMALY